MIIKTAKYRFIFYKVKCFKIWYFIIEKNTENKKTVIFFKTWKFLNKFLISFFSTWNKKTVSRGKI